MKHGSPTEVDLERLADEQEQFLDKKGIEDLLMYLKRHREKNCEAILTSREVEYLIRLLEKVE